MVALAPNTFETSTWDVLDGFPKLLSRAREVKTRNCTEAPTSKSLVLVEIWQAVYDCRAGLESFTRDPIGFDGSDFDLYECLSGMVLVRVDPSGLADFPITGDCSEDEQKKCTDIWEKCKKEECPKGPSNGKPRWTGGSCKKRKGKDGGVECGCSLDIEPECKNESDLQKKAKSICGTNADTQCGKNDSEDEKKAKRERINKCIGARNDVMNQCYRGGDCRHLDVIGELVENHKQCTNMIGDTSEPPAIPGDLKKCHQVVK